MVEQSWAKGHDENLNHGKKAKVDLTRLTNLHLAVPIARTALNK